MSVSEIRLKQIRVNQGLDPHPPIKIIEVELITEENEAK